jgi:hypothetical protein
VPILPNDSWRWSTSAGFRAPIDRGDHRERADRGSGAGGAAALATLRAGVPGRDRRFRHRLFEPRLSQGAAARLSQDRQEAERRTSTGTRARPGGGARRDRHGALAGLVVSPKGWRPPASSTCWRRKGANIIRASCVPSRWTPDRILRDVMNAGANAADDRDPVRIGNRARRIADDVDNVRHRVRFLERFDGRQQFRPAR